VTAATTPAAATAATECAGLPGGADHRERRELFRHLRRAALGAGDFLVAAHQLLEVRLAAHADELVDRHRPGSLGPVPDNPQTPTRQSRAETFLPPSVPDTRPPPMRSEPVAAAEPETLTLPDNTSGNLPGLKFTVPVTRTPGTIE